MIRAFTAATALALLAGCGPGTPTATSSATKETIRADAGCEVARLPSPLRQTLVLLDARAIQPSQNAREFVERNAPLRDMLLAIADPSRIQSSGVTALRERVSIGIVPIDGSPAQQVFTGCPPGLSATELAEARKTSSSVSEFFTGDVTSKFQKQADAFNEQLIGGLNAAGNRAVGGTPDGTIAQSRFLSGVRSSRALFDVKDKALRLILLSDFSALDPAGGFAEGLAAGRAAGGRFALAEVDVVAPAGKAPAHAEFLRGWFLGQSAHLASVAAGRVGTATPPPARLRAFVGTAAYPGGAESVDIRIGDDGNGKLAASWLTLKGTPDRATPMTGTITCQEPDRCTIRSDDGGFAQAWNPNPGATAAFDSEWPFAGMRNFAFDQKGVRLTGKISDDGIYIGNDTARDSIAIDAAAKR